MKLHTLRQRAWLLLLVLASGVASAGEAQEDSVTFEHHDWQLVCDNTRTCRAAGYHRDGDEAGVSVLLTRHAGPGTPVTAQVVLGSYLESEPPRALSIHVNGRESELAAYDVDRDSTDLAPAQIDALLHALTRDSRIDFVGPRDGERWSLSDRGAAAVLLKMDEVQGRIGTPGALVRRGQRAEAEVLPALPIPVVREAPRSAPRPGDAMLAQDPALRAALFDTVAGKDRCHAFEEAADGEAVIRVRRLGDGTLLASTLCWRAAYNEGYAYWLIDDRAPFHPRLVTANASDDHESEIHASHKGRGLGDCWLHESWAWDGERFVATSRMTTGLCRLIAPGGAWQLPTLVTRLESPADSIPR